MAKFKPGQSGNPAGRRPGTRCRATMAAEALISGRADELVEKIVSMALQGDTTCLKACLDRLVPPRRDMPVRVQLPLIEDGDLSRLTEAILKAATEGTITPSEAQAIAGIVEQHRKAVETTELEARIRALEERGMK
ncbi:DUF5681 domain-containing protein [Syntrophobacter fumaroxidans]|uniref:DUF5681 domain-containing protein n=1 Tax=Syntrophobacter fumaroxidans TaxID=119484 RepID=UPI00059DB23F|nr:DUF5681 domain-containing protein [Syntrophobacter fumaroxidans]